MTDVEHISVRVPPYQYQERVTDFLCGKITTLVKLSDHMSTAVASKGRGILYIDPGLGKSRIAIMIHQALCWGLRVIVVCKKNSINTWRREYAKWVPGFTDSDIQIITGTPQQRRKLWKTQATVVVTTWDMLHRDMMDARCGVDLTKFEMMIGDEIQKLRNRKTVLAKAFRRYVKQVKYFIGLSGTLLRVGPQDLWTSLNFCDPSKFPSYWKFSNTFCEHVAGFYGQEYVGPKNLKMLAATIAPYVIRLRESDDEVDAQRPPKTRDYLPVTMTPEQKKMYDSLSKFGGALSPSGELILAASVLSQITKLRQLLVCPKMLDESMGVGAAISHVVESLEDDPHQVIFTPFAAAIPFIRGAVVGAGYPEPYVLKGGTKPGELRRVEEEFNLPENRGKCCIVSIKFAESFELPSARQGRFIGWEWTVDENTQAEDRLHRLNTPHPINILYYKYDDTIEGEMLQEALDTKANNIKLTMSTYINTLRGGTWNQSEMDLGE